MTDTTERYDGTDGSAVHADGQAYRTWMNPAEKIWRVWVWRDTGLWREGNYLVWGPKVEELMNLSTLMRSVTMREANEVEKEYWWKRSEESGEDVVRIR